MVDRRVALRGRVLIQRQIALSEAVAAMEMIPQRQAEVSFRQLSADDLTVELAKRPADAIRNRQDLAARAQALEDIIKTMIALAAVEGLIKSKRHDPC